MLAWAKWYVETCGLAVFPLPPLRKKTGHLGITSATTDLAQIEAWWTAQPDANIAVVGARDATRFVIRVDVDPKRAGDTAWSQLVATHGCPETMTVKTPSGGFHYYFHTPEALGNGTGTLPPGIDIRGHTSGYTVGAPSSTIEVKGESVAGRYDLVEARGIADAPQWLLTMLGDTVRVESVTPITEIDDEQFEELRSALMSDGMLRDWARWSDNGLALRTLGDRGYQLWSEYSRRQAEVCSDQEVTDNADTWWRRHGTIGIKSDYRSIFARAQALGWQNPKTLDTTTLGFGQEPLPAGATPSPEFNSQTSIKRKFEVISEHDFIHGADPEWRIDGLLPEVGLAMIYGASGVSKSFFSLDLLAHIADGREYGYRRHRVKQGRVVYVMAEGAGGMRKRIRAYRHVHPAQHKSFNIVSAAPNLMTPEDVGQLSQSILESGGAEVVVLDTLHATMAGADENSAKDMGILLANARSIVACLKCLVIFIHHTGKDEARGARGSSSIRAAMETEIEIVQNKNDPNRRVARLSKQRDGDDNVSWEYTLEPVIVMGDNAFSSAIVKHSEHAMKDDGPKRMRSSKEQDYVVDAVKKSSEQYPDGIALETLIAMISHGRSDMRPDNIRRSVTRAIDRGAISIDTESNIRLAWL